MDYSEKDFISSYIEKQGSYYQENERPMKVSRVLHKRNRHNETMLLRLREETSFASARASDRKSIGLS